MSEKGIKQLILLRIVYYVTDCNFIMGKFNKLLRFFRAEGPAQLDCPEPLFLQFLKLRASLFEAADWVVVKGTVGLTADGASLMLKAQSIEAAEKPEEEYIYPSF